MPEAEGQRSENVESPFVVTYDSFEDMLADQRRKEEVANGAVLPIQTKRVTWGTYAMCLDRRLGIWIYGEIWSKETLREKNTISLEEAKDCGFESVEAFLDTEDERWQEIYDRGYRTGTWYSVVDPITSGPGEIGDHHLSELWPIHAEQFLEAKERGWVHPRLEESVGHEVAQYLKTFTE